MIKIKIKIKATLKILYLRKVMHEKLMLKKEFIL